jgi:hypothetical protein
MTALAAALTTRATLRLVVTLVAAAATAAITIVAVVEALALLALTLPLVGTALRLAALAGFLRLALVAITLGSRLAATLVALVALIGRGRSGCRCLGGRRMALDRWRRWHVQLGLLFGTRLSGRGSRSSGLARCTGARLGDRLRLGALGVVGFFAFDIGHGQTSAGRR